MSKYQPWKRWKQNIEKKKNNEYDATKRCEENLFVGLRREKKEEKKWVRGKENAHRCLVELSDMMFSVRAERMRVRVVVEKGSSKGI